MFFSRPHNGELGGNSSRSGEQDVARTAGDIGDAQIEQRCFRVGRFQALGDEVVERVFDEGLDKIVRSVVRSGSSAFIALIEREFKFVPVYVKRGFVFEQAFINRAEFLHVQSGVVDADELVVVWVFVDVERTETAEQHVIAESTSREVADGLLAKEVPSQWGDSEFLARSIGLE